MARQEKSEDIAILLTISGGLIEQVKICKESLPAVNIVSDFVQTVNMEKMKTALNGDDELVANVNNFFDGNYQFMKRLAD